MTLYLLKVLKGLDIKNMNRMHPSIKILRLGSRLGSLLRSTTNFADERHKVQALGWALIAHKSNGGTSIHKTPRLPRHAYNMGPQI